jgi:hypothetical protein
MRFGHVLEEPPEGFAAVSAAKRMIEEPFLYSPSNMPRRHVRFRPPGVKPWTRIGPLGPFRRRLGLAWVVAPLVLGIALVVAFLLFVRI